MSLFSRSRPKVAGARALKSQQNGYVFPDPGRTGVVRRLLLHTA
jgi:hypothetical protein